MESWGWSDELTDLTQNQPRGPSQEDRDGATGEGDGRGERCERMTADRCLKWRKMAAWLPRLPATYEPLTGEKQYRRLAKLNVYSIQRTSKQRRAELIYMFYHSNDWMRASPTPPTVLCTFTFLCNVDTLHVCIYKLCCSCMFFMISSALGGRLQSTTASSLNSLHQWIPLSSSLLRQAKH